MPFNINTFKHQGLVYGGARPSLFSVEFNPPAVLPVSPGASKKFTFSCRTAELPASSVASIDIPYFGRKIKISGERSFADWSVTVMNDEDFSVRTMFESWANALNRHVSNVRDTAFFADENYKVDLTVIQYGKDGSIIRAYKLIGAFPTEIGSIALDWDSTGSIETFPVSFAYDYWVPEFENSSDKKAGGGVAPYLDAAETDGIMGPG
jgi:hypothetical protein